MNNTLLYNEDELFPYLTDLVNGMNLGNFLFILVYDKGMLNYRIPKVSFRRLFCYYQAIVCKFRGTFRIPIKWFMMDFTANVIVIDY